MRLPVQERPLAPGPADPDVSGHRPTVSELFVGFLLLGLTGFGGVLPLARRAMVERLRWLTAEEFTELLGLCQFLPGGNIVNMSVAIGMKFRGPLGAITALSGLIAAPSAIVIMLGMIYDRFHDDPHVRNLFGGMAAAAAGLLAAMAIKIALQLREKPASIVMAAATFLAIAVLHLPLVPTMLVLAPISILARWKLER